MREWLAKPKVCEYYTKVTTLTKGDEGFPHEGIKEHKTKGCSKLRGSTKESQQDLLVIEGKL